MKKIKRALVVYDEGPTRVLCEEALKGAGCRPEIAEDGREALERLRGSVFDLVISGLSMAGPGAAEGTELYQQVVEEYPYLRDRFLFIAPPEEDRQGALHEDCACITTPFHIKELLARVTVLTARPYTRVLVAEDDLTIRELLREVLSSAGYGVGLAGDGAEALEMLAESEYELILSDFRMPRMDGAELYLKMAREFPGMEKRVLFMTGMLTDRSLSFFEEHGCGYILKPFPALELLTITNNFLEREKNKEPAEWKGVEGRKERRHGLEADCRVCEKGLPPRMSMKTVTQDISRTGIKLRYGGRPLVPGSPVIVHIHDLYPQRDAKVVWSKGLTGADSLVGLGFAEPVPLPADMDREPERLIVNGRAATRGAFS
ncbi:MAG: response regulator [Thermodesulfobacteriota bacterium]